MYDFIVLYDNLRPKAFQIISGAVKPFSNYEKNLLANDYTIDFLYSKSFRETYDHGCNIIPFFRSYIRKKCCKAKKELEMRSKSVSLDKIAFMCGYKRDLTIEMFELEERFRSQYRFLKDKYYVVGKKETIALQDAFMAWLKCLAEHGTVSYSYIAKALGVKKNKENVTKGVLAKVKRDLRKWEKWNTEY
jgi:hypothetical protein